MRMVRAVRIRRMQVGRFLHVAGLKREMTERTIDPPMKGRSRFCLICVLEKHLPNRKAVQQLHLSPVHQRMTPERNRTARWAAEWHVVSGEKTSPIFPPCRL